MERNERLKAADKCASKYTNENEAHIARTAFMLGCEFEAQGEIVKGVVLETEDEHWKPSEEQMKALNEIVNTLAASPFFHQNDYLFNILNGLREELKKLL